MGVSKIKQKRVLNLEFTRKTVNTSGFGLPYRKRVTLVNCSFFDSFKGKQGHDSIVLKKSVFYLLSTFVSN